MGVGSLDPRLGTASTAHPTTTGTLHYSTTKLKLLSASGLALCLSGRVCVSPPTSQQCRGGLCRAGEVCMEGALQDVGGLCQTYTGR